MITINKDGNNVVMKAGTNLGWYVNFTNNRGNELDAILRQNHLASELNKRIETIRREAYNKGWKDAKSKKVQKKDWFNGNINSDYI